MKHFFAPKDNQLKRPTLTYTETMVKTAIPATINNIFYKNLSCVKFTLKNTIKSDIEKCHLVFTFDKDAIITKNVSRSQKNGKNFYIFHQSSDKNNEIIYEVTNLNREEHIDFEFDLANVNQKEPRFLAIIQEAGFELNIDDSPPTIVQHIPPLSYQANKLLLS